MDKEVKITPPEGYEIDKEASTFDCIKFKKISKISKRWRDDENAMIDGFYITSSSSSLSHVRCPNNSLNYNTFLTEKHGRSALAIARISQIMANDERFGGAITDEEWDNVNIAKYGICRYINTLGICKCVTQYQFLAFHTKEQRDLFLEENEDLVKDYLMV